MFRFMNQLRQFFQKQASSDGARIGPMVLSDDQALEQFLKFHSPKFMGEPDDCKAESFIAEMEKIFEVLNYSDYQKVNFVSS